MLGFISRTPFISSSTSNTPTYIPLVFLNPLREVNALLQE